MQIIHSKYKSENIRRDLKAIFEEKSAHLERYTIYSHGVVRARITLIGILVIALLAAIVIDLTGKSFMEFTTFFLMCVASAILVVLLRFILYGSFTGKEHRQRLWQVYVMLKLYYHMKHLLRQKRKLEKIESNMLKQFENLTDAQIEYVLSAVEEEDSQLDSPKLDNGRLRFDVLDEAIDALYEGVYRWANKVDKM